MTTLEAPPAPGVTIPQIIKLVDELANISTPKPASGIVRLGLVTELRNELRPSLGSTGKGNGGDRMPIDPSALELWEDITGRVQALPEDLGDPPATKGSLEQILNAWARDLVAADIDARTRQELAGRPIDGLNQDALTTIHRRVERIRDLIDTRFNPPRRIEYPYCPDCRATHVALELDGQAVFQRALTVTFWPTNPDRLPQAACTMCGSTWTGIDAIEDLNNHINALAAVDEFNARIPEYSIVEYRTPGPKDEIHLARTVTEAQLMPGDSELIEDDNTAAVWIERPDGTLPIPVPLTSITTPRKYFRRAPRTRKDTTMADLTSDPTDPRLTHGIDSKPTPQADVYLVLSDEERAKGFIRPVRQSYQHTVCGAVTRMSLPLAETYARDPKFYGATYCVNCGLHAAVSEFVWDGTTEVVGS